jgi:hypothetical protein
MYSKLTYFNSNSAQTVCVIGWAYFTKKIKRRETRVKRPFKILPKTGRGVHGFDEGARKEPRLSQKKDPALFSLRGFFWLQFSSGTIAGVLYFHIL